MNSVNGLRWLVIDLNGYFASCEQQEQPALRGKPIVVAPVQSDTTCAIAASYPAKAFGIKTGTMIREARRLCPDLIVVPARPKLYVEYHHRILKAIEACIPIENVLSIDEVACELDRTQRAPAAITRLAAEIKQSIRAQVGECLTSSIGAASNRLLAKLASDMQKPDGLTILEPENMPAKILHLEIGAICGIGRNMSERLRAAGLDTMPKLWAADAYRLRHVWGGVMGARFHALLHGADLPSPIHPRRSMGHQHVLAPEQRSLRAAEPVVRQLLARAAERLRQENFYCRRLTADIKWIGHQGHWADERRFAETQDTRALTDMLMAMWHRAPNLKPLRVGVSLSGLVAADRHQFDLFAQPAKAKLTDAIDGLNEKFGRGAVGYGAVSPLRRMTSKIAFQRVPGLGEF
jgi:DNA polymerase-4